MGDVFSKKKSNHILHPFFYTNNLYVELVDIRTRVFHSTAEKYLNHVYEFLIAKKFIRGNFSMA